MAIVSGTAVQRQLQTEGPKTAGLDRTAIITYIGAVLVLAGMIAIQGWQGGLGDDVYAHLSVFRELSTRPIEPLNPYVSSSDPTLYFSPYSVGLGLIGWATGAQPITLYHLGAALNLVLLTTGFWMMARSFSRYRWTPHLVLFFSLLAWGLDPWKWSGFWSLNSIGSGLGYPSMFASGLALITLAGLCRYFANRSTRVLAAIAVGAAAITVTHLLTAVWFLIAILAIVAAQSRATFGATAVPLLISAFVAAVFVLLWPYYSILDLVSEASNSSAIHDKLYQNVVLRAFLLVPGIVAVAHRARRNARDPLVWMFVGAVGAYVAGYLLDFYALGRVVPLVALSAHLALADLIAGWLPKPETRRTGVLTIGVIGAIGLLGSFSALFWMTPRSIVPSSAWGIDRPQGATEPYRTLGNVLAPADVAFASPQMNKVVPSVTGRVVVPGYLTPLLSDRMARDRAGILFFADRQSADERQVISSRWNATHIVVGPADLVEYPWLMRDYPVVARTDAYAVFLLKSFEEE